MTLIDSINMEKYIDVAVGKNATQSSFSYWSTDEDAKGAISGVEDERFGFHTDEEDNPWWMLDLGQKVPAYAIEIVNRKDGFEDKERSLNVEVSVDGENWILIHDGLSFFGSSEDKPPLFIPIYNNLSFRFLRLSLRERNYFHLTRVSVFVEAAIARALELRTLYGLNFPVVGDDNPQENPTYTVIAANDECIKKELIGFKIFSNGAFGNSLFQYSLAIEIALNLKIKYIQVAKGGMLNIEEPITLGDITFLPHDAKLPDDGCFLQGQFFVREYFPGGLEQSNHNIRKYIANNYIKKIFGKIPFETINWRNDKQFLIHIRSGDIFSTWIHPYYIQPPLAFYQMAINKLLEQGEINSVKLVFENRLNPVIDELEKWLKENNIPFYVQSGSLIDDISSLLNAKHMAFGLGTFGMAISLLSDTVKNVFYFSPDGNYPYNSVYNIENLYNFFDKSGGYIKSGHWDNSEEQRKLMVDYPIGNLGCDIIHPNQV